MGVGRPKGLPKTGGGSRKGIPNKVTADLKAMILGALADAGGQKYLLEQARENPNAFLTLIGRVLPTTLDAVVEHKNFVVTAPEIGEPAAWEQAYQSAPASSGRPNQGPKPH